MKLISAPRQPFVGLALMAATGIITAEILPFPSVALIPTAIMLAVCILSLVCWPRQLATYAVVGAGFFLLHNFQTKSTEGQQLADELGNRPRVVTVTGCVISEPKIPVDSQRSCSSLNQLNWKAGNNPRTRSGRCVGEASRNLAMNLDFLELPSRSRRHEIPANSICVPISRAGTFAACSSSATRRAARSFDTAVATRSCAQRKSRGHGCKTFFAAGWRMHPTCKIF